MNPDVPPDIDQRDFCCERLFEVLMEGKLAFAYDRQIRELQVFNKGNQWVQRIDYCPFCGTKRPSSLASEWEARLEAYGNSKIFEDDSIIPEDLRSDVWWKKEGL